MTDAHGTDEDRQLVRAVRRYLDRVNRQAADELEGQLTPLGEVISEHLAADAAACPVLDEQFPDHRLVDFDIALDEVTQRSEGRTIGVSGGDQRLHSSAADLLRNSYLRFSPGPVDFVVRATGPVDTRRVVAFGVRLLHHDGRPVAVIQRTASQHSNRIRATLEVIAEDPDDSSAFLAGVRELARLRSVLRGQVLAFTRSEWGMDAGATFLPRPEVAAEEIVLPDGVLDSVVTHVVGIGVHRAELLAAGRHLKRGVLLHGPPGTGKTLTVRHLLFCTPETTAVVLTGASIQFVGAAAELARTFQPSIVVLEDIDLVAMERQSSPQPLLFEVLDALDGIDGDADIAFLMTTNRVQVLERALTERPGRVDLAVELPLPGRSERRALFRRYAAGLPYSPEALDSAADRSEGTTGSFAKELIRRAVLRAAVAGRPSDDGDLDSALANLLESREALTRRLLGGGAEDGAPAADPDAGAPSDWSAYSPRSGQVLPQHPLES